MQTNLYADPHNPLRLIPVKAITRPFGQMPGEDAPASMIPEEGPPLRTEVLADGGRVAGIGYFLGFTDTGVKLQALYYAITKGAKDMHEFKSYTAARHWLWLDSEAR